MFAVVIAWLLLASVLNLVTIFPGWFCAIIAAIPFIIWYFKRPEDF